MQPAAPTPRCLQREAVDVVDKKARHRDPHRDWRWRPVSARAAGCPAARSSGGTPSPPGAQQVVPCDAGLHHLVVEVVALAGALPDAREHQKPGVRRCDVCLMSSIIVTVLPTPAPPKRPTLPPSRTGRWGGKTLRCNLNRSFNGESSSNVGAVRWMPIVLSASTGPRSSISSPASMMRPSVSMPANQCRAGVDDLRAAQAVGAAERDGADDAVRPTAAALRASARCRPS